ncbi:MAG: hypothetical protein SGPRY_005362 [Prymnesium sp.]
MSDSGSVDSPSRAMLQATAQVSSAPSSTLLLQHARLDVLAAGAELRRQGVSLADVLPRVQPNLQASICGCRASVLHQEPS